MCYNKIPQYLGTFKINGNKIPIITNFPVAHYVQYS